ncbi:uncharacterized protein [Nicotiana tomentosiformis]|uniref:uncharacterized protein n=1 Tax=Nicotiana tomentosiformis TaxID=4098 RepID=UPI00051ACF83|nr:uncharacterized protein LOC104118723 [Nicotiana tomentosiformis]XP_009628341.1 uncharacterized protein LOC104118723 [Nicotiana tomentosiformis]XP_009628342.1 uncharacterized protein LOC104118723 [Nicotiana tomentosiformis]XP_009628343.1 uncharacterized protein LOC104118723 [Nicotiana tomentosiformis]XP_009628344.1 uncharacterized protein LOC104118723 [Nicotiana tomentosiformis]XP_009628345.1 uncharacterized protein LOC104118723 [Nicotiana tomentosiformis]
MELEFDKYCIVDGSPTTVLPSPRHRLKGERRKSKGNPKCSKEVLSVDDEFTEISFHKYRSVSCKNVPSRKSYLERNEILKRGSVYQSSKDVRRVKKTDAVGERRKIEFSGGNAAAVSFDILDALCSSREDNSLIEKHRSSFKGPIPERGVQTDSSTGSLINSDDRENRRAQTSLRQSAQDSNIMSQSVVDHLSEVNRLTERDPSVPLPKSLSAKLALPQSPARSESDSTRSGSQKSRFSPIRKMFDPFGKSKSVKSPLSYNVEPDQEIKNELVDASRDRAFHKSLLHDFSSMAEPLGRDPQSIKKEIHNSNVQSLPAHLHGSLRVDKKNGLPFFEFSVKSPEDSFVAKSWKVENTLNWVYTFHSIHQKRKSNANGWGSKDSIREPLLVGQMQVSCYLCTDIKKAGDCDNSMVTEFVLYDTAHSRKQVSPQDSCCSSPDLTNTPKASNENSSGAEEVPEKTKLKLQPNHAHDRGHLDSSIPYPLGVAQLQSRVEVAAISIEVPFEKRESLKFRSGDAKADDQPLQNLLDVSLVEQRIGTSDAKVNVVIPSGHHGLPTTEGPGPSSLLDRWRMGGGCDCGGWDMACPLHIFGNPNIHIDDNRPLVESQRPLELFVQGRKDKAPALTMTLKEDGQYSVDFHAQLSALQAFSICVAILHSTETSIAVGQENNVESLQSNILRVFVQDDIKGLLNAVREEKKQKVHKKVEQVFPSFVLNPPFSPIGRV